MRDKKPKRRDGSPLFPLSVVERERLQTLIDFADLDDETEEIAAVASRHPDQSERDAAVRALEDAIRLGGEEIAKLADRILHADELFEQLRA